MQVDIWCFFLQVLNARLPFDGREIRDDLIFMGARPEDFLEDDVVVPFVANSCSAKTVFHSTKKASADIGMVIPKHKDRAEYMFEAHPTGFAHEGM